MAKDKERHAQRQKIGRGGNLKEFDVGTAEREKRPVSLRDTKGEKKGRDIVR